MGFDNENAYPVGTPVVIDIETVAHEEAAVYLPLPDLAVIPPANYKKEEAIRDYTFRELVKRQDSYKQDLERCSLEPDLCRIVALGVMQQTDSEPYIALTPNEDKEAKTLTWFWNTFSKCQLVGFNIAAFDLLVLVRRSQLLGISVPDIQLAKYRHPTITDLLQLLTFDWQMKWRSQRFYLTRFGLRVPDDPYTGADIAALVAADDWAAVEHHVRCDVLGCMALAQRLGVITKLEV